MKTLEFLPGSKLIGKVWQLFGNGLNVILDELNDVLAA